MEISDKVCKGNLINEPCLSHDQCDVGLGCIKKSIWPFESRCESLKTVGQGCETDYECETNMYCWYPNADLAKANKK